jgi:lactoylglutathione lyase
MGDGLLASGIFVVFVSDLDRSRSFYTETLGMTPRFEDENSSALVTDNGLLILLNEAGAKDLLGDDAVTTSAPHANFVIVVEVEDVDVTHRELTAKGVSFLRAPEDRAWGLRTAHFCDPDGYVIEINHALLEE